VASGGVRVAGVPSVVALPDPISKIEFRHHLPKRCYDMNIRSIGLSLRIEARDLMRHDVPILYRTIGFVFAVEKQITR